MSPALHPLKERTSYPPPTWKVPPNVGKVHVRTKVKEATVGRAFFVKVSKFYRTHTCGELQHRVEVQPALLRRLHREAEVLHAPGAEPGPDMRGKATPQRYVQHPVVREEDSLGSDAALLPLPVASALGR